MDKIEQIYDQLPPMIRFERGKLLPKHYFLQMHKQSNKHSTIIEYKSNDGENLGNTYRSGKTLFECFCLIRDLLVDNGYSFYQGGDGLDRTTAEYNASANIKTHNCT